MHGEKQNTVGYLTKLAEDYINYKVVVLQGISHETKENSCNDIVFSIRVAHSSGSSRTLL